MLFVNKHPVFVLNLTLDPTKIDVNVHPTKAEIKIEQKKEVTEAVFNAVRETLRKNDLLPIMDLQTEQQLTFGALMKKEESGNGENNREAQRDAQREEKRIGASKYAFEPSEQSALYVKESEAVSYGEEIVPEITPSFTYGSPITIPTADTIPESDKLPPLRLLGQVHKTFFVAETPGGIVFIDQHVVQERVLYERFMEQLMNQKVAVQNLLRGEVLELTPVQKLLVEENKEKLIQLGFVLEEFGENSFVLKAVPTLFGRLQPSELLFEVISELHQHHNRLEQIQEEIITRMACRASVKAGDTLTVTEMHRLLYELSLAKFPYTCPHGRAVLIKMDVEELERKFRRK